RPCPPPIRARPTDAARGGRVSPSHNRRSPRGLATLDPRCPGRDLVTDALCPPCDATPDRASFTTPRLAIEALSVSHAAGLHAALDHPDVHRFLPAPDVTTLDVLRARIERLAAHPSPAGERWWNFAVRLRADRALIGRLEATTYGDWGEIAYVFGP